MTEFADAFAGVLRFVRDYAGLALDSRRDSAEQGIRQAMARAEVTDPARYLERLVLDENILNDLLVELTVGETYFFREPAQFQFLRREVLPELRCRQGEGRAIRAWSAGCASGEEAYSLAILLEEEGFAGQVQLLATDLSRAALAKARRAVYGDWSLRGDGAAAARPYLKPAGKLHQLDAKIRRRVTFAPLNLASDEYPALATGVWGMDLILCRNVLIYFDRETVRRVARRLFESLAEGGWLVTASSDPPLTEDAPFEAVVADEGVFYRRAAAVEARETASPLDSACGESLACRFAPAPQAPPPVEPGEETPAGEAEQDAGAAVLRIRELANGGDPAAASAAAAAVQRYPLSAELGYLHAVLLLGQGKDAEAVRALHRVLYLDRSLALAHFTLGSVLRRSGDRDGSRRAYRNARDLCAACPPDQAVPLADGETAGQLVAAAEAELAALIDAGGVA